MNDSDNSKDATDRQETAQALQLAIAQIETSLRESDRAVETLIAAMTAIAGCVHRIEDTVDASGQSLDAIASADSLRTECKRAKDSMQHAITAFQFYDLLSQRLQHVEANLKAVVDVMHAPDRRHAAMCKHLHEKLRSVYSLEQEQIMYQALLNGLSAENAIEQTDATRPQSCGDIELF